MSFTAATVYLPIVLISLLYLPTIIYTIVVGIKFSGGKNWIFQTLNNPVYFIFPILTSMSFYGKPKKNIEEEEGNKASNDEGEEEGSKASNDIREKEGNEASNGIREEEGNKASNDIREEEGNKASNNIREEEGNKTSNDIREEEGNNASEEDKINMHFSIKQSNILYMFFLLGSVLCIFGDVYHQDKRGIFWLRQDLKMSYKNQILY